ncbi:MAG TPA: 50S ribosomal protein L30 [Caldithrix abyssi]|uniref:50S ribosomal protein L30 n=1 Tax=Caldithrix abyssi TaxID=187145 RepID=A0A7V5PQM1_CALAY|nr:50S ribosomal protein L30 [Caldithrix abyssi]
MVKAKEKQIKITQIKSKIGYEASQGRTLEALGIKRMNHSVVHKATPQILGMVKKVRHLVKVEEV